MKITELIDKLDRQYNVSRQTIIAAANIFGPEHYDQLETIIESMEQVKQFFNEQKEVTQ